MILSPNAKIGELRSKIQLSVGQIAKLVSASIGDIAVVFSRSPAHKHQAFADLEWMILPAVLSGQVYIAE